MAGGLKEEVVKLLERAGGALTVTKTLFDNGHFGDSMSKAYYAMFYAASALLIQNDLVRHKHSAIISAIGQYFVKNGKLKAEFHQMLIAAFEDREVADYNVTWNASSDEANKRYLSACEFVETIKKILEQGGS